MDTIFSSNLLQHCDKLEDPRCGQGRVFSMLDSEKFQECFAAWMATISKMVQAMWRPDMDLEIKFDVGDPETGRTIDSRGD